MIIQILTYEIAYGLRYKGSSIKISSLIALALMLSSCNYFNSGDEGHDAPDHKTTLEFDPRLFREKEFRLSSIADDIRYVPLDNDILIKEA